MGFAIARQGAPAGRNQRRGIFVAFIRFVRACNDAGGGYQFLTRRARNEAGVGRPCQIGIHSDETNDGSSHLYRVLRADGIMWDRAPDGL